MPDMRMRRILLVAVLLGVILSCAGTVLYITAPSFRALEDEGRIWWVRGLLCVAWLILVPIFFYMLRLRRTARRSKRKDLVARKDELDQQLASMVTPEGIRAIGGEETTTLDTTPESPKANPEEQPK